MLRAGGSRAARRAGGALVGGATLALWLAPAAVAAPVASPAAEREAAPVSGEAASDAPPWMRFVGDWFGAPAPDANESGATSREGGFMWPLDGELSSGFGPRYGGMHTGLDIDGDTGEEVVAAAPGRVVHTGPYFGYGETIMIDHGRGYSTLYGHLSRIDVVVDQDVGGGEAIGLVGCSGACTGDHLHFEIRVRDEPRDPKPFLPRAEHPGLTPLGRAATLAFGPTA